MLHDRAGAKDRQALVFGLLCREPKREWSVAELVERLRRHGNRSLIESALQSLIKSGLAEATARFGGGRGTPNRYRLVPAERKEAANG